MYQKFQHFKTETTDKTNHGRQRGRGAMEIVISPYQQWRLSCISPSEIFTLYLYDSTKYMDNFWL